MFGGWMVLSGAGVYRDILEIKKKGGGGKR